MANNNKNNINDFHCFPDEIECKLMPFKDCAVNKVSCLSQWFNQMICCIHNIQKQVRVLDVDGQAFVSYCDKRGDTTDSIPKEIRVNLKDIKDAVNEIIVSIESEEGEMFLGIMKQIQTNETYFMRMDLQFDTDFLDELLANWESFIDSYFTGKARAMLKKLEKSPSCKISKEINFFLAGTSNEKIEILDENKSLDKKSCETIKMKLKNYLEGKEEISGGVPELQAAFKDNLRLTNDAGKKISEVLRLVRTKMDLFPLYESDKELIEVIKEGWQSMLGKYSVSDFENPQKRFGEFLNDISNCNSVKIPGNNEN